MTLSLMRHRAYVTSAQFAAEELTDDELDRFQPELGKRWEAYRAAEKVWRERLASAELVATNLADRGLVMMNISNFPMPLVLVPDDDADESYGRAWHLEQHRKWLTAAEDRRKYRRRFVDLAKLELATAPLPARLRSAGRRLRAKPQLWRHNIAYRLKK